jgi:tetratricopeptide (TPR) repeat protein
MRIRLAALILLALCSAPLCFADTIYLKKGSKIEAQNVREENGAVKYEQNGTTFSIPASWVERVEVDGSSFQGTEGEDEEEGSGKRSGARDAGSRSLGASGSAPAAQPMARPDVKDLAKAERQGPGAAAHAYFEAGRYESERGNLDQAIEYFERAHSFLPANAAILSWQVSALMRAERYREALPLAERLVKLAPREPDALNLLAMAQYKLDRVDEAIRNWKESLRLEPNPGVEHMLAKSRPGVHRRGHLRPARNLKFLPALPGQQDAAALHVGNPGDAGSPLQAARARLGQEPPRPRGGHALHPANVF